MAVARAALWHVLLMASILCAALRVSVVHAEEVHRESALVVLQPDAAQYAELAQAAPEIRVEAPSRALAAALASLHVVLIAFLVHQAHEGGALEAGSPHRVCTAMAGAPLRAVADTAAVLVLGVCSIFYSSRGWAPRSISTAALLAYAGASLRAAALCAAASAEDGADACRCSVASWVAPGAAGETPVGCAVSVAFTLPMVLLLWLLSHVDI